MFKLVQHKVTKAFFIENKEAETKKDMQIEVEGSILIPKNPEKSKYLVVQLKLECGGPDERLDFKAETLSKFEIIENEKITDIKEDEVKKICIPIALSELRKTVKKITEAYGITAIDLPPFEEEMQE